MIIMKDIERNIIECYNSIAKEDNYDPHGGMFSSNENHDVDLSVVKHELLTLTENIASLIDNNNQWVSVEDRLPEEPKSFEYAEYYVYADSCVESYDIDFKWGKFVRAILDHDGDVMDYEDIENVSHWMLKVDPLPPKSEAKV